MRAGVKFPPLVVFHDGENYWLADGFHRISAALQTFPNDPIEVEVIQGTLADAQWYSFSVNKAHGLRRTNEDKERVVKAALQHPKAVQLSSRQMAEHCGVSEFMIRKYRDRATAIESQSTPANSQPSDHTRKRKGRDGRTINTAKIGKEKKNAKNRRTISIHATTPTLGHSLPNPMISLSLPPKNPGIAAATIFGLFDRSFVETLIEELSQHLKGSVV
jgi:hypothetical protein